MFELKTYTRIGNRIARRVLDMNTEEPLSTAELQALSRSDIVKIDFATIARGLDRLRADTSDERHPSLIIPVSFISLSSQEGRAALAGMFKDAATYVRAGVICGIRDFEGVPQAALLTATSLIKPSCMFIVGGLSSVPDKTLGNARGAGLQAISFDAPQKPSATPSFWAGARSAIGAAKLVAKSVMIYRLDSARRAGNRRPAWSLPREPPCPPAPRASEGARVPNPICVTPNSRYMTLSEE